MKKLRFKYLLFINKTMLSASFAITVFITGLTFVYMTSISELEKQNKSLVRNSIKHFNIVISSANTAISHINGMTHIPCSMILPELRREVTKQIYVRSLTIMKNEKVACTSFYGEVNDDFYGYRNIPQGLSISNLNILTPEAPVLYLRSKDIIAVIDIRYLLPILRNTESPFIIAFNTKHDFLDKSGLIFNKNNTILSNKNIKIPSESWDFSIIGGYERKAIWIYILKGNLTTIILLIVFSLTLYIQTHRMFISNSINSQILRQALAVGRIKPFARAIYNHDGSLITGMHVEARWLTPEGDSTIIPDTLFLEKDSENMRAVIAGWLIDETADYLKVLQSRVSHGFCVSFSIHTRCCQNDILENACTALLNTYPSAPFKLVLELTNNSDFTGSPYNRIYLQHLQQKGIGLSLASINHTFTYMHKCNIDFITIDEDFVDSIEDKKTRYIIGAVTHMAASMQIKVIAKGVSTQKQARLLHQTGIKYFQGNYYSQSLPLSVFINKYFLPLI